MILEKSYQVSKNCTSTFGAYNVDWILLRSTGLFFNFPSTLSHDLQWSVFSPEEYFNSQALEIWFLLSLKISLSHSYSKFWIELAPERERFIKSSCFSRYLLNIYNLIFIWSNYDRIIDFRLILARHLPAQKTVERKMRNIFKRRSGVFIVNCEHISHLF